MLKFELSEHVVAIIYKALGAQPFDLVAPVITELQKQINAQQQKNGLVVSKTSLDDAGATRQ